MAEGHLAILITTIVALVWNGEVEGLRAGDSLPLGLSVHRLRRPEMAAPCWDLRTAVRPGHLARPYEVFSSIIILWDQCHTCGLSLTQVSLWVACSLRLLKNLPCLAS